MKIKHQTLDIPEADPFANCKLDRKPYALVLTDIVNTYSDGFVLAINNDWGTGKTTFVKMWQQHLENEQFQTIYFNAWENDFDSNSLVALMAELNTLTNAKNKTQFKSVLKKGAIMVKNVVPTLAKAIIEKHIGEGIISDLVENSTKGATEIFDAEIKEYAAKKKNILEFREELEKFVKKTEGNQPLIFIIDELDRCRPNYAVEVLEQIKHFFSVPGIIFVLSIDKNHLASSIKGFYGSENINTDEYLRRFIDLEYSIPQPSNEQFCNYLYNYFSLNDFFNSPLRTHKEEREYILIMAVMLFDKAKTTLRQQEKILGQVRLILATFKPNQYTLSHILFLLIFIKNMKVTLYRQIEANSLSLQMLSNEFAGIMPSDIKNIRKFNLVYLEALLLHLYNNDREYENKESLFEFDSDGQKSSLIQSQIPAYRNSNELADCLYQVSQQHHINDVRLGYLLERINLTAPILS